MAKLDAISQDLVSRIADIIGDTLTATPPRRTSASRHPRDELCPLASSTATLRR
jgi:hypothetical protein